MTALKDRMPKSRALELEKSLADLRAQLQAADAEVQAAEAEAVTCSADSATYEDAARRVRAAGEKAAALRARVGALAANYETERGRECSELRSRLEARAQRILADCQSSTEKLDRQRIEEEDRHRVALKALDRRKQRLEEISYDTNLHCTATGACGCVATLRRMIEVAEEYDGVLAELADSGLDDEISKAEVICRRGDELVNAVPFGWTAAGRTWNEHPLGAAGEEMREKGASLLDKCKKKLHALESRIRGKVQFLTSANKA